MKRLVLIGSAAIAAMTACSNGTHQPAKDGQRFGLSDMQLGPYNCSHVDLALVGGSTTDVVVSKPTQFGITINKDAGTYVIDEAQIAVTPSDALLQAQSKSNGPDPLLAESEPKSASVTQTELPAADRQVLLTFDGKDDRGATLPAGKYTITFAVKSRPAPGAPCSDPSAVDGTIATVEWAG